MLYSHELGSTWAKYTVQLGQSNNFLYTVPYQQIKPWSLLSKGNQSKSWEKVWANWNCLSLVTSHVVGTSRAEHTTSDMPYKQMRLCHRSPQDNQSKSLEKVWPLVLLSLGMVSVTPGTSLLLEYIHWSLLLPLAPAGQSKQLLICHVSRWRLYHR